MQVLPSLSQAIVNPKNTFYSVKSLIGQKFTAELAGQANLRYTVQSGEAEYAILADESGKTYTTTVVTSFLLQRMKETAENNLGAAVRFFFRKCSWL